MPIDITQHALEIEQNRTYWQQKPLLQKVYKRFYTKIAKRLIGGSKLELGSGIGQIKEFIPDCVTSDLFPNPGVDRVESAYLLSFPDGSLNNIVVEIKPMAQTSPPRIRDRKNRRYINEVFTYVINEAKWKAAEAFCAERKMQFRVITEKELFGR